MILMQFQMEMRTCYFTMDEKVFFFMKWQKKCSLSVFQYFWKIELAMKQHFDEEISKQSFEEVAWFFYYCL